MCQRFLKTVKGIARDDKEKTVMTQKQHKQKKE